MNPHHNSNQIPAIAASLVQQVNSVNYQQTYNVNVGGLYPNPNNNRPIAAPPPFMNLSSQPIPLQNTQFPNGVGGFNPQHNYNHFLLNPSQQEQGQFFATNSMDPPVYKYHNVGRPLQLQNPNYAQYPPGNFPPIFQNQITDVTSHQNPGFPANQQLGMSNFSRPILPHANQGQQRFLSPRMDDNVLPNMGPQLQGNPFRPLASGSVQTHQSHNFPATRNNLQIAQGVGPQNHFPITGPVQHGNQGQQRFVSPMMDVNAARQIANTGQQGSLCLPHAYISIQTQNPCPTVTNFEDRHGNVPQSKNFKGDKMNDASHKGSKSQFHHAKHVNNGNMNKEGKSNAAVNSGPRNSNYKKKKVSALKYTDEEIKQWREDRKKHYPTRVKKSKEEETSMLRRQELKKILVKQAELGCEVADIPSYYLSGLSTPPQITSHSGHARICTLNVGTLDEKLVQLTDALRKRKVDIACIQETKWKGAETIECNGYKLWYSGVENAINGVGILLSENLKDNVVEIRRCHDRIMVINVVVEEEVVNVISAYAPHPTLEESEKRRFWESLDDIVRGIPDNECMFLGGDFNGHIGKEANGYERVHGGFGFGTKNEEGRRLLEFATAHDLAVLNSFFRKKDVHLITFQNEGHNTQNDYLLLRKRDLKACTDCKVLPGETNISQHRLLIMDLYISMIKSIAREEQLKDIYAKQAGLQSEVADLSGHSTRLQKKRRHSGRVRLCTLNVGTLNENLLELTNVLSKRKVEIACIQETKWKGEETTDCNGYKLWHAGLENMINGVGILLSTNLKDNVVEVKRCRDRIMAIKVAIEGKVVNIVCAYTPHATLEESEKRSFWESLNDIVKGIPEYESMFLGGDFSGHIGKEADGYEIVHGGLGFGTRNEEGRRLLEFATAHNLAVVNSYFRKRDTHLITFSGEHNTQNDYLLLRKRDIRACTDCKVLPGETSASQHKLLVMDLYMSMIKRIKKNPNRNKTKREQYKRGRSHNKRGAPFQNDQIAKKARPGDQDNPNKQL